MRVHRISTATMLVLAVSGLGAAGSGTAFAGTGPAGGKAKARAGGGSSTGGDVFQQNVAQSARQNNNCNNSNTAEGAEEEEGVTLTGARAAGRCVTSDGSVNAFSRIHNGPAEAEGGSATTSLGQQNTAQRGRQNNNCNNTNNAAIDVDGGSIAGRCADLDFSFNHKTFVKGSGARAEGGSAAASVNQHNTAQVGRQNNNCNSPNDLFEGIDVDGGRIEGRCGNKDASFNHKTFVKAGGARAEGGSSAMESVNQHNVAQEGRQNNNCNNPNHDAEPEVMAGRIEGRCGNKDASFNKHTRVRGGGARAQGGSANANAIEQNIAQVGRQNNNCNNPNDDSDITVTGAG
ncbi:hypothetical protein [Streptomyces sp. NPDC051776]|uniref:hypothetical protein n=1 Tax=Streptomyces sp. NPDC051776 TaxID=3155414 RepID=UPI0034364231